MTTAERPSDHLDNCYYEDYTTAGGHRIRYRLAADGEWCEHIAPGFWAYVHSDKVPPEIRVRGELSMANTAVEARRNAVASDGRLADESKGEKA